MKFHPVDLMALASRVAGLSVLAADTTFQSSITALFGVNAPKIIALIGLVGILATDVIRFQSAPTITKKD